MEERGEKEAKITHKKFRAITAITLGMDPAYRQTTVNAREMWESTPGGKAAIEAAKREQERLEAERQEHIKAEMKRRERVKAMCDIEAENENL